MSIYLTLERVLRLYGSIAGCTLEEAADHLRNRAGLEGALVRPQQYAHYQEADIPLQAAVLAHGIAETQPFIDGNKRVALAAMLTFLELNGCWVDVSQDQLAMWVLSLSQGMTEEQLAEHIRNNSTSFWD